MENENYKFSITIQNNIQSKVKGKIFPTSIIFKVKQREDTKISSLVFHTISLKQIHPSRWVLEVVWRLSPRIKRYTSSNIAPRSYYSGEHEIIRTLSLIT